MKKRIGLEELYLYYPHKVCNITTRPYVPKKEHTENEYSLSYPEWKAILQEYFGEFLNELFTGLPVELPYNLGVLRIKKYRRRITQSFAKSIQRFGHSHRENKTWVYEKLPMTDGYGLLVDWKKGNRRATELYRFKIAKSEFLKRCSNVDFFNFSGR
jgi:hypothetical protein